MHAYTAREEREVGVGWGGGGLEKDCTNIQAITNEASRWRRRK